MNTVKSFLVQAAITSIALGQFCEHQWEGEFADHKVDGVPYLQARQNVDPPPLEIRPLIVNGPSSNRVDLIFFGDGYTEDEKDKFFADALFLANNITDGQTFVDVLPVLNFWAGFSPSNESGVGTGGKPLDTIYGLYRDGTELRGVYYDKPEVARAAWGLGGTFTVTTSSPNNGPVIIRHELGHSIIGVGEEYDGGEVYTGVNAAKSTKSVPWTQCTGISLDTAEYVAELEPDFHLSRLIFHLSPPSQRSGVTATSDFLVEIDGKDAGWEWNPAVGEDRYIYNIKIDEALTPGEHEIKFTLLNEERQGSAQLCNFEVIEYGDEEEFDFEPRYHGLYPTPTNNLCLMRDTYSSNFCDACIEGLWLSLLGRLTLIDNITQEVQLDGSTNATLNLLPLANLREVPNPHQEAYTIFWYGVDGITILSDWTNNTSALLGPDVTEFGVEVRFWTEQVRVDSADVLVQKERYSVE
ncbi:hypothetical protein GL218_07476 [Daldinia childiae]|uniref:uncharacterized protein n=1 Tax=Daldinia childiae TaxID=326645 RepID=UPI0014466542|nr:uncharacterized protein GL218_07476 [Daldinia childiae]KAF3055261.1 hypothetical protein GL218_07476 [Daldinia childiae]